MYSKRTSFHQTDSTSDHNKKNCFYRSLLTSQKKGLGRDIYKTSFRHRLVRFITYYHTISLCNILRYPDIHVNENIPPLHPETVKNTSKKSSYFCNFRKTRGSCCVALYCVLYLPSLVMKLCHMVYINTIEILHTKTKWKNINKHFIYRDCNQGRCHYNDNITIKLKLALFYSKLYRRIRIC